MINKLRRRFIRIAILSVTVVMLVLCLVVNIANFWSMNTNQERLLNMISENQGVIPHEPKPGPGHPNDGPFDRETPFSTRYFTITYSADGTVLRSDFSRIAAVTASDTEEYLSVALRHGVGYGWCGAYQYQVTATDNGYLAVFLDCNKERQSAFRTAALSLGAMAVCVALVSVLVVLFSRRAIDPVVKASQRQKQFVTDASHELKTPITVIATCLTLLEMETGKQKWIDKAKGQTEKLKDLVGSLVTLSKMDEDESPLQMRPFALSEAVGETADSFRDYAETAGHPLELSIQPEIIYTGDEYAVRQLVSILLDNAVKYASPEGTVSFRLEKGRKGIVIETKNPCPPMDKATTAKLFDRFYRGDASRTGEGFGIGLSIARSIAEGHHGSIKATYSEGALTISALLK